MLVPSVPSCDYAEEFLQGPVKTAMRDAGASSADLWKVRLDEIRVPPGLNVRIHDDIYEEHINEIRDSILQNGYYDRFPLAGYAAKDGDKTHIYCTGGFTRLEAAKRAVAMGAPLERIPVVMHPPGTTMQDLTVALVVDNIGTKLRPYEVGIAAKRLIGYGWTVKDIATKFGLSRHSIDEHLYLQGLPIGLRQLVIERKAAASWVCELSHKHGPIDALALLQADLDQQDVDDMRPVGAGQGVQLEDRAGRPRPKKLGSDGVTRRIALGAIDYALNSPTGLEFLRRWRSADKKATEELHLAMKKKPEITPPTADEVTAEATKAMMEEADRQAKQSPEPDKSEADDDI